MNQEKYSLSWQNYSDHLKSMMKDMMEDEDFSDVTLVTEDKKHIKAHVNILRSGEKRQGLILPNIQYSIFNIQYS